MKILTMIVVFFTSTIVLADESVLTNIAIAANNVFEVTHTCSTSGDSIHAEHLCTGGALDDSYKKCLEQHCEHCAVKSVKATIIHRGTYKNYAEGTVILQGLNCKIP